MVIYHSLNYSTEYYQAFRYLAFLPPSFILITGFLLVHYFRAPTTTAAELRTTVRGFKLLLLFILLNIASQFVRSQNYHGPASGLHAFFSSWYDIFISGSSRQAVFEVLLPIAYLLIVAPALLRVHRIHHLALALLTVAAIGACVGLKRQGISCPNLFLFAVGLVGMLAGRLTRSKLARFAGWAPFLLIAYLAHYAWGRLMGQGYLHQMLGAVLALAAIYGFCARAEGEGWLRHRLERLGQYSLIAYIGQIAILQIVSHFAGRPEPISWGLAAMLMGTLVLTSAGVELVHWLRSQSNVINYAYRTVLP